MSDIDDGGSAFPHDAISHNAGGFADPDSGMTLRDYFAASCQADDRLVKCIRAMDDTALELFALYTTSEREEWVTEVEFTNWKALPSEVAKVRRRLELEAHAIARVRYMQADAMIIARREKEKP